MYERKVFISDELIQDKARRIQTLLNQEIPVENQLHLKFSNSWLQKLKIRNYFKCYRSHGESGNVDLNIINSELPVLQETIKNYSMEDIWNADEFAIFYQMPSRDTIAPARILGRKRRKKE